jgi:predicted Rossmann-fold nucleotide-binding protein
VILLRAGEWTGLLGWLRSNALADGRIDAEDLAVLHAVEEPVAVCQIVQAARSRQREHASRQRRRYIASG